MTAATAHKFIETTAVSVTAAAAVGIEGLEDGVKTVRFVSDIATHLKWANSGDTASVDATDGYVPAGCVEYLSLGPDKQIEVIAATGAGTGDAWFTVVSG